VKGGEGREGKRGCLYIKIISDEFFKSKYDADPNNRETLEREEMTNQHFIIF
jgi:hypothetical protein